MALASASTVLSPVLTKTVAVLVLIIIRSSDERFVRAIDWEVSVADRIVVVALSNEKFLILCVIILTFGVGDYYLIFNYPEAYIMVNVMSIYWLIIRPLLSSLSHFDLCV